MAVAAGAQPARARRQRGRGGERSYGGQYTLAFRARAGGPVIGAVSLPMSGCGFVSILDNGKEGAGLLPGDGAGDILDRIAQISGVNWPVGGP